MIFLRMENSNLPSRKVVPVNVVWNGNVAWISTRTNIPILKYIATATSESLSAVSASMCFRYFSAAFLLKARSCVACVCVYCCFLILGLTLIGSPYFGICLQTCCRKWFPDGDQYRIIPRKNWSVWNRASFRVSKTSHFYCFDFFLLLLLLFLIFENLLSIICFTVFIIFHILARLHRNARVCFLVKRRFDCYVTGTSPSVWNLISFKLFSFYNQ